DVVVLLNLIASAPTAKDELKLSVLTTLGRDSKTQVPRSADLEKALKSLILSDNAQIANSAMPLAARWDSKGALAAETKGSVSEIARRFADERVQRAAQTRRLVDGASRCAR